MIKINKIINQSLWQKFFDENCSSSFLHSWDWGEFQKSLGYDVLRLGVYEKNKLQAIAQVIKMKAKRGNFLFIPHGPIVEHGTWNVKRLKHIIDKIKTYLITIAKNENFDFIRIAPILENTPENQKFFSDLGFKTAPIYMHAETTWELPLNGRSDDDLLSQMRKTHRYLIKKAIRDGVIIEKTTNPKALKIFYDIYQQTAYREKFTPFSFDFIKKEFETFSKAGNTLIFLAKINKNISQTDFNRFQPISTDFNYLAASIIIFTKHAGFYHQGASIHTKIPVTYLLQWEAIKEAKNRGCQFYNFWGIYDDQRPNRTPRSWQGLTLFKTGFGGQIKRFLLTQDYIISSKYYLNWLWEKLIMWKRGA